MNDESAQKQEEEKKEDEPSGNYTEIINGE